MESNLDLLALTQEEMDRAKFEALRAEIEKGPWRRTQEIADQKWPRAENLGRWRCCVMWTPPGAKTYHGKYQRDKGWPEIDLWAENDFTAQHNYRSLCGITNTAEYVQIAVTEVDPDAVPPWLAEQQKQEQEA